MVLHFRVFNREDFEGASQGDILGGYIERNGNKQLGVVKLGNEEHDPRDVESCTEKRRFRGSKLGCSETEEDARNLEYSFEIEHTHTVLIFY